MKRKRVLSAEVKENEDREQEEKRDKGKGKEKPPEAIEVGKEKGKCLKEIFEKRWSAQAEKPPWFQSAHFGVMIHLGVYSVPAFCPVKQEIKGKICNGSEWYWRRMEVPFLYGNETRKFHKEQYGEQFSYRDFADMFTMEHWDPKAWAKEISEAGAKYVVITSKHHDGFCLWGSQQSPEWNSVERGPKRDLLGEFSQALEEVGVKFGIYFSLLEWKNSSYIGEKRKANLRKKNIKNIKNASSGKKVENEPKDFVLTVVHPQIKDLVIKYRPKVIFFDGHWERGPQYWKMEELLQWLYEESPVKDEIVVNDRLGKDCSGKYGDYFSFQDRHDPGKVIEHKWESCYTIGSSWGFNAQQQEKDYKPVEELIKMLIRTRCCNGNFLLNLGPTSQGLICPSELDRLRKLGSWVQRHKAFFLGSTTCLSSQEFQRRQEACEQSGIPAGTTWYLKNQSVGIDYVFIFPAPPESSPENPTTNLPSNIKQSTTFSFCLDAVPEETSAAERKVTLAIWSDSQEAGEAGNHELEWEVFPCSPNGMVENISPSKTDFPAGAEPSFLCFIVKDLS